MRASLPMYDRPATKDANQRFWGLIRRHLQEVGIDAPAQLSTDAEGAKFWTAKDMVFSQTCGMPYRTTLHGKVKIVGTPDYGIENCPPGYYRSVLIKRIDDPRSSLYDFSGTRVALNGFNSQSGFAALANAISNTETRFSHCIVTGAHSNSVAAVASGKADIAAIDIVTWCLLAREKDVTEDVEVFAQTDPTPGLPFICNINICAHTVFMAVADAITALSENDRELLMLRDIVWIDHDAYMSVPTPAREEQDLLPIRNPGLPS